MEKVNPWSRTPEERVEFYLNAIKESRKKLPGVTPGMSTHVSISGDGYTVHWKYVDNKWDWHHVDYD